MASGPGQDDPKSPLSAQYDRDAAAADVRQLGKSLFTSGRYEEALACYLEATSDIGAQPDERSRLLSNAAECYLRLGRHEECRDAATRALASDATNAKASFRRARAREALGDVVGALEDVERCLAADPGGDPAVSALRSRLQSRLAPQPDAWTHQVPLGRRLEWLVDCYRLRAEDDRSASGELHLHGLCVPDADEDDIVMDFLVFCKLVARRKIVPTTWNWEAFLEEAATLLPRRLSRAETTRRWGRQVELLASTATTIYSCAAEDSPPTADPAWMAVQGAVGVLEETPQFNAALLRSGILLQDVGGCHPWCKLHTKLKEAVSSPSME